MTSAKARKLPAIEIRVPDQATADAAKAALQANIGTDTATASSYLGIQVVSLPELKTTTLVIITPPAPPPAVPVGSIIGGVIGGLLGLLLCAWTIYVLAMRRKPTVVLPFSNSTPNIFPA